jgi:8-oxo-dGTP diphosphatase
MSDRTEVGIAILTRADRFLMQLRDNIPNILYPGLWGFFGGHMEAGETPESAVVREIAEEIGYDLTQFQKFGCYSDRLVIRHIFYAPLTVDIDRLTLNEGWDLGLLSREQILAGKAYSRQAESERSIGIVHRQVLLDFIDWQGRQ